MTSSSTLAPLAHRLERLDGRFDDLAGVGLALDEAAPAALHPPPFEQAVDERLQAQALFAERIDASILELGIAAAQAQRLGEHADRGERSAQLVRHLGDEVALELGQVGLAPHEDPDEHARRSPPPR